MAAFDEIETLVQSRKLADAIVKELEQTLTRPIAIPPPPPGAPPAPTLEPEELLPPPPSLPPSNIYDQSWSLTMPIAAAPAALKKTDPSARRIARRKRTRTHLHWAVLAMCVAIGLGLWRDPVARQRAVRVLRTESHRVTASAKAKAAHLVKLVSARII